ncbi:ribosome assembly cofactor RimP [Mycoplasmopsis caviae]|uniref:Ribosome assembly cofactor RimP n=1 Tax=Mycoplasmopsis caviae TaxID=55603 RepID=A0A3P8L712_9BACT|nr:ribosome assembly cofactor RimP [Mycoplasmopsis caviae]UUD35326.1 ribosome assembly cofactor RimP [Mycoplasmopsis caviae]VDR41895.1 Uncharacterised BCR, YhbC family COG0779 [Mycoplasmopsis caviae]
MNWKDELVNKFGDVILDAKIINEDGLKLLDVSVKFSDLNDVEKISKEINEYIDLMYSNIDVDSLSVHSPGVELAYKIDDLINHINEMLTIYLIKNVEKQDKFNAKLLEVLEDKILIHWNSKGQFRKIFIGKNNIKKVEKYIKFN